MYFSITANKSFSICWIRKKKRPDGRFFSPYAIAWIPMHIMAAAPMNQLTILNIRSVHMAQSSCVIYSSYSASLVNNM